MPSVGMTAMGNPKQEILMATSSYAPWAQTRLSHSCPPVVGGVFQLETLGLLLSSIVNANSPKQDKTPDTAAAITTSIIDILPSFPGAC